MNEIKPDNAKNDMAENNDKITSPETDSSMEFTEVKKEEEQRLTEDNTINPENIRKDNAAIDDTLENKDSNSATATAHSNKTEGGADGQSGRQAQIPDANAGIWSALFNNFAKIGPLFLLIAVFCTSWYGFYKPDNAVYCPAEFKYITAFLHSIAENSWLAPTGLENGSWSLPQWPGFFWFMGLLALIPGLGVSSLLLPVAELCAGFLAVLAVWWLTYEARFGSRAAFASGLILVCCPIFTPLPHFMGPSALAAALLVFALLCFHKGLSVEHGFIAIPLACIFTALAGLTGGIPHFVIPLVTAFVFVIWRGNFRRIQRHDSLFGFICLLAIIGIWLGMVMINGSDEQYLPELFANSIIFRWPPDELWWIVMAAALIGSLPWILIVFGVSWIRVLTHAGTSLAASRHDNGSAMLWISLVLTLFLSIWTPQFHSAAIIICSIMAVLLGKAFLHLPPIGNRFFFFLATLITICAGLLLFAMHFNFSQTWLINNAGLKLPEEARNALLSTSGISIFAALLAVGGIPGFYFARKNRHSGGLIYACILAIALCQPVRILIVPALAENPQMPLLNFSSIAAETDKILNKSGNLPTPEEQSAIEAAPTPDKNIETNNLAEPDTSESATSLQHPVSRGNTVQGNAQQEEVLPAGPDLNAPRTDTQEKTDKTQAKEQNRENETENNQISDKNKNEIPGIEPDKENHAQNIPEDQGNDNSSTRQMPELTPHQQQILEEEPVIAAPAQPALQNGTENIPTPATPTQPEAAPAQ